MTTHEELLWQINESLRRIADALHRVTTPKNLLGLIVELKLEFEKLESENKL